MPMSEVRQIIVANMKTPFPIGRLAAHVAHAALAGILDQGEWVDDTFQVVTDGDPDLKYWMKESFTKAVCKAWGDEEILKIEQHAKSLGIHTSRIEEEGYITALSIGPASGNTMNQFKYLPLL